MIRQQAPLALCYLLCSWMAAGSGISSLGFSMLISARVNYSGTLS